MTNTLSISKSLSLPVELVTETIAILGIRGSGKTVTATVITEEMLERGHQVVVIDPTDVWWGLKSSRSGKREGFPVVVAGGESGDIPIAKEDGAIIADFLVEHHVSMILSLRHLRKTDQRSFVTAFCEQLYHRKGKAKHRTAIMVVIDEASAFVPQHVGKGEARMVGAIEDLVRRGRASGFGMMLIDQRPASVNKNVLTQLQALVCHQVTSPQDRKALREWISQHDSEGHEKQFLADLSHLSVGQAYFWIPSLDLFKRVSVRMRKTFDSSQTPKLGEQRVLPGKMAEVPLDEIKKRLAESIERGRERDPAHLQRRIRELESQVRDLSQLTQTPSEEEIQARIDDAVLSRTDDLYVSYASWQERLENAIKMLRGIADDNPLPQQKVPAAKPRERKPAPSRRPQISTPIASTPISNGLTRPQERVMEALAKYLGFGLDRVTRQAAAALAGYKVSGHFSNVLGQLNSAGLISYPTGGMVALTDEGRQQVEVPTNMTRDQVHDAWRRICSGPQQKLLDVLIDQWPSSLSRDDLAGMAGYRQSGHFSNVLGQLKTYGAIEFPSPGQVVASDILFP